MERTKFAIGFVISIFILLNEVFAGEQTPMPRLRVDGRYLKDAHGNIVNLHGYAQTFSPWFNERGSKWNNYDVNGCLVYNKGIIDRILAAGWKVNFVRMHMDPYWSNTPGCEGRYEGEECFNETRFRKYLDEVFAPMAEYAISRGLYVIFRPPGVCPEKIEVGGVYHQYLIKVWGIVSKHPKLKNHPNVMFELANEPIEILGPDGTYGANTQGHFDNLKAYFQAIVDTIRTNADNILWIPGLGYQSLFAGFAVNPIEGENIGYAAHVYPGWFNSGQGYEPFQKGWDKQVKPVADFAPVVVTEMDWAPEKYNASWGKGVTGTAGGDGFGANFKKIVDDAGNVSWLLFTEPHLLASFTGAPPAAGEDFNFLNDPEACPWPVYHWYQDYALEYYPRPDFEFLPTSDNGDGTFANPTINADFPAPALIRKGDTYYMISTNINADPAATVLESKDLVNWEYSDETMDGIPLEIIKFIDESDPHSGSFVQTQSGEWWAMKSYDKGPLGSFPHLLPLKWENDIPVLDETVKDAARIPKPDVGRTYAATSLATNDVFRHYKLGPQWGWIGKPDNAQWTLLERAGYLRLKTVGLADSLHKAQNTLSQRIFTFPAISDHSFGTVRMEIDQMREGDVAGLSVFGDEYSFIGVTMTDGKKKLVAYANDQLEAGPEIAGNSIYLRALVNNATRTAGYYYSLHNSSYTKFGNDAIMEYIPPVKSGYRFGIFNYATIAAGGFVDIDWFSTESDFAEDQFYPANFEEYTKESLTLTDLAVEGGNMITALTGGVTKLKLNAIFADGHVEEVSALAEYANHNPEAVKISRGYIISLKDGEAALDVTYTGPLGEQKHIALQVYSTTFPLTKELFDPDIWGNGVFDETTRTLHTGPWGFGGWRYDGVDLSGYKYLVARLGSDNAAGVDFRLFDGMSYWGSPAIFSFGNSREVVVILDRAMKEDGTPLNVEHIYIAGFWSTGSAPFVIDTVFLSNSSEYDPPAVYAKDDEGNELTDLDGFSYIQDSGPSESRSFLVSGELLTDDISIAAPINFEISFEETGEYVQSLTLRPNDGRVEETLVYVRLKAGLGKGNYSGSVEISSPGALTRTIQLSGDVERVTAVEVPSQPDVMVVSTWYYTIMGKEIKNIESYKGIVIVRQLLSNGAFLTKKIYRVD